MPRDANGVYQLPLAPVQAGQTIATSWANPTMDDIAAALNDSVTVGQYTKFVDMNKPPYNLVPDNGADTTTVWQQAIDDANTIQAPVCFVAEPGVYEITNLLLRHQQQNYERGIQSKGNVRMEFRRRAGGDTDYMVASSRWIETSQIGSNSPFNFYDVIFNGNSIAKYACVLRQFGRAVHFQNLYTGAVEDGCRFTRYARDGTATSTYLSENFWHNCSFYQNTIHGMLVEGPTDGRVLTCTFSNNGSTGFRNITEPLLGWQFGDIHSWNNPTYDFNFERIGDTFTFRDNIIEGTIRFGLIHPGSSWAVFGPNNYFYRTVTLHNTGTPDAGYAKSTIISKNNRYGTRGGDTINVRIESNFPDVAYLFQDDVFDADSVISYAVGNTGMRAEMRRCWHAKRNVELNGMYSPNENGPGFGPDPLPVYDGPFRGFFEPATNATSATYDLTAEILNASNAGTHVKIIVRANMQDQTNVRHTYYGEFLLGYTRLFGNTNFEVATHTLGEASTNPGSFSGAASVTQVSGGTDEHTVRYRVTLTFPAKQSGWTIYEIIPQEGRGVKSLAAAAA